MIWKAHLNKGSWIGPVKVIIQEGPTSVFCNNAGSILRAAPENIRPVSAVEARLVPLEDSVITRTESSRGQGEINPRNNTMNTMPSETTSETSVSSTPAGVRHENSQATSEQPDQEPEGNSLSCNNSQDNSPI